MSIHSERISIFALLGIAVAAVVLFSVFRGRAAHHRPFAGSGFPIVIGLLAVLVFGFAGVFRARHIATEETTVPLENPPRNGAPATLVADKSHDSQPALSAERDEASAKKTRLLEPARGAAVEDAPQPTWVATPPRPGNVMVVKAGPETSAAELKRKLDRRLREAVKDWLAREFDSDAANSLNLAPAQLRSLVVTHTYTETQDKFISGETDPVAVSDQWLRLEITPAALATLNSHWREQRVEKRLWRLGAGTLGVVGCIAAVHGFFRVDDATRGRARKRLVGATIALVAAIIAAFFVGLT